MALSISVVFPMWNEEAYIQRAVAAARQALARTTSDHEIIIVNDASTDRTGELADALAREDPHIKVVHHPKNRKLGGSLRSGYALATKDLVLYSDADLPFDLLEMERAVRLLEYQQADVLSAYRFDRTSEGLLRTIYTIGYSALIRTVFRLRFRDINFSFKLFRRALAGPDRPQERGQLHRRRVPGAGPQGGRAGDPDRRGLLPAHARPEYAGLPRGDRGHPAGDGSALARAQVTACSSNWPALP